MAKSTWYEVYDFDGDEIAPEPIGGGDTFEEALEILSDGIHNGDSSDFTIERIDRDGDEAEHTEVAYVARQVDVNNDDVDVVPVRIARPNDVPAEWRPGAPVKKVGKYRFKPLLDPVQLPGRNELLYQLERLPNYEDTSYRHDVSPSRVFSIGGTPYKIFIAPARIMARTEEQGSQYAVFKIERKRGQDISEAIDEGDIDWDPVLDTDDPSEVMGWLAAQPHEDDAAERFRLLDLDTKRKARPARQSDPMETDAAKRFALLDLDDDPTVNPSRRRRARRNPDEVAEAKEKYEEFHRHKPKKIWEGPSIIPKKVRELGKAKAVLYRSDKNDPDTGRKVPRPINYIHDHDAGVKAYSPSSSGGVEVPTFIRDAEALVVLGKCLGFDFEEGGKVREAKGIKPYPDLCATPCGKALLVIQDRREVIAIIWGGALGVEARGIVG